MNYIMKGQSVGWQNGYATFPPVLLLMGLVQAIRNGWICAAFVPSAGLGQQGWVLQFHYKNILWSHKSDWDRRQYFFWRMWSTSRGVFKVNEQLNNKTIWTDIDMRKLRLIPSAFVSFYLLAKSWPVETYFLVVSNLYLCFEIFKWTEDENLRSQSSGKGKAVR